MSQRSNSNNNTRRFRSRVFENSSSRQPLQPPARRPTYINPPRQPQPQPKKSKNKNRSDFGSIVSDVFDSITNSFKRPTVLLSALVVTALVITHYDVFDNGFVGKWVKANPDNSFAQWIGKNEMRFIGLLIFVPTLIDLPKNVQILASVGAIFWCLIVPETSVFQYVLQSLSLHTYFRVKQQSSRIAIILFVAVAYYVGWMTISSTTTTSSLKVNSTSPR